MKNAVDLYREIKKRQLNIAICVNLKAINKDIAYFDTCFGFESAVEETQRFIEQGYALSKSNFNSVGTSFSIKFWSKYQVDSQDFWPWMQSEQLEMPIYALSLSLRCSSMGRKVC